MGVKEVNTAAGSPGSGHGTDVFTTVRTAKSDEALRGITYLAAARTR
jgi:hypothetical protein